MTNLYDLCERRHSGNPASRAAFAQAAEHLPRRRAEVLAYIRSRGVVGATAKEIATFLGLPLHAVSGRCSELKCSKANCPKRNTERINGSSGNGVSS